MITDEIKYGTNIGQIWDKYIDCGKEGRFMIPKDPVMLLSFINLKLRDFYDDLDALCDDLDIDRQEIENKLAVIDYRYDSEKNQFV